MAVQRKGKKQNFHYPPRIPHARTGRHRVHDGRADRSRMRLEQISRGRGGGYYYNSIIKITY